MRKIYFLFNLLVIGLFVIVNQSAKAQTSYVEGVPYLNQNCNYYNPTGTCQITSMAMVLNAYGANVDPDDIYERHAYTDAMNVSGWQNMFNYEAQLAGLSVRSTGYTTASIAFLRESLAQNKPITVHGYFTGSGHVMVLVGYTGTHYIANDPYGDWNEVIYGSYSGNYCGSTAGKYVYYSASAMENAIYDGGIWLHVPTQSLSPVVDNKPVLVSPAAGAVNVSNPVTFNWQSAVSGSSYRLQVSTDLNSWDATNGFTSGTTTTSTVPVNYGTGSTSYTWSGAQEGVTYYWTVRSWEASSGVSQYATPRSFTIQGSGEIYSVTISHPAEVEVGESVAFTGTVEGTIQNVVVSAGGYQIANAPVTNGTYSFSYAFNTVYDNRVIVANAFNNGVSVAQAQSTIDIVEGQGSNAWGVSFAENVLANSVAYENEAWGDISSGTPCVAFVCVGLRNHPTHNFPNMYALVTEGPSSESCSLQLDCSLEGTGYFDGPFYDLANLQKGDIVFTDRTVLFDGAYYSSHAMIFYEWSTPGSTSYAKFLDYHNERGLPYERNVTVSGTYDKALFYYRYNGDQPEYKVTLTHTSSAVVGQTVAFSGTASAGIENAKVTVDGWEIANETVVNEAFSFNYTFNGTGTNRAIVATGYINGAAVATATSSITVNPETPTGENNLGIWLWYLSETGYSSHSALAADIAAMGVKRIYVKVADGTSIWSEATDASVVNAYKNAGLEVWAWAYNYPGNDVTQANALYYAAQTGYEGYVLDIEKEFDGATTTLHNLLGAMDDARSDAINNGYASSDFKIYCTTWGNPDDHGMRVDIIDQYVDAHMPQTYLEVWGTSYMANPTYWVNYGTQEYRNLGCTKPIHHIVSAEYNVITASQINEFFEASGPESSVWRIPGTGTSMDIWNDLESVNWDMSGSQFQSDTMLDADLESDHNISIFPNPAESMVNIDCGDMENASVVIINTVGQNVFQTIISQGMKSIDISDLHSGLYLVKIKGNKEYTMKLMVK